MAQDSKEQDKELNTFGFNTSLIRRNLIIGIIAIQFSAIVFLFKCVMDVNKQLFENEQEQLQKNSEMYEKIINRIDDKFVPIQQAADSVKKTLTNQSKR